MSNKALLWFSYVKYAAVFAVVLWYSTMHSCAYCGDDHTQYEVYDSNYGYVCDSCYDLMETKNLELYM